MQAISFFTSDMNYLFEGVYYGPLIFLSASALITCCITTYFRLGVTTFIAALFYLLILLLMVTAFLTPTRCWTLPRTPRAPRSGVLPSGNTDPR